MARETCPAMLMRNRNRRRGVRSPIWCTTSASRGAGEQDGSIEDERDAEMKVEVVCYSGYKGDERPVHFRQGGQDYFVEELLDQWYGPDDVFYKVRADDGNLYILRHNEREDEWSLESFRRRQPDSNA